MDLEKNMVVVDGNFVTSKIENMKYYKEQNVYRIKYKNDNQIYTYSEEKVQLLKDPVSYNMKFNILFIDGIEQHNVKNVYEFSNDDNIYYRIFFESSKIYDFNKDSIKILKRFPLNVIQYLREVADVVSLTTDKGSKILSKQMEKVNCGNGNFALEIYLHNSNNVCNVNQETTLIFPFGCNSSQYKAVENAINKKISVIEGPPGTGKTQTILNIMANIIIRDMNCQIVSFNNTAIQNVKDILRNKYKLDFFVALLGKNHNKELFIQTQNESIPYLDEYKYIKFYDLKKQLKEMESSINKHYELKKDLSLLINKRYELDLEYKYFKELLQQQNVKLIELTNYNIDKVKLLHNEILSIKKIHFWNKLKYIFKYKIGNFKFYRNDINSIIKSLQNIIYINELNILDKRIDNVKEKIELGKTIERDFVTFSMLYLKKYLYTKYKNGRKKYSDKEIWSNPEHFLQDYPVILSTTYSSRNTVNNDFKFDYIIMDESSQIDVVTGTLALSSAKYAVVIGDDKQLGNIVEKKLKEKVYQIFYGYEIDECYSYSKYNFLESIKKSIPNVPNQLLVEHYRCHPKIINFCNKEFYNNQLVVMTTDSNEKNVIKVIRTVPGNHERNKCNQREADEIVSLLKNIDGDNVAIITPFVNQVRLLTNMIDDSKYEIKTVHKFQGRQKDIVIFSAVQSKINYDFANDSRLLNVAFSRAVKQLYVVLNGNNETNRIIKDFIDYVNYNNMDLVESKINSAFDLLYNQNKLELLNFYKKHNKVSKYDSENLIYYMIDKIIHNYSDLKFHIHQSLNDLIADKRLLTYEEKRYASNHLTHIDFYIFNSNTNGPVLAIEVDGYKNHRFGTDQFERDKLKNSILEKYGIPLVRLSTTGSEEETKIRSELDRILNK